MFTKIRNRMESEEGFTLIELLVVILIIGILAAIAIPSFLNQRTKGQDACASSMVKQMQTAMKTAQIEKGDYAGIPIASLTDIENTIQAGACGGTSTVAVGNAATAGVCTGTATADAFCVSATSSNGKSFALTETAGVTARTCGTLATAGKADGGCKANSTW